MMFIKRETVTMSQQKIKKYLSAVRESFQVPFLLILLKNNSPHPEVYNILRITALKYLQFLD